MPADPPGSCFETRHQAGADPSLSLLKKSTKRPTNPHICCEVTISPRRLDAPPAVVLAGRSAGGGRRSVFDNRPLIDRRFRRNALNETEQRCPEQLSPLHAVHLACRCSLSSFDLSRIQNCRSILRPSEAPQPLAVSSC